MLHTTSAQLLQSLRRRDGAPGMQPVRVSANLNQGAATAGGNLLYDVPKGQVLLVTQFVQHMSNAAGVLAAKDPSPDAAYGGFNIYDKAGTNQSTAGFAQFIRRLGVHDNGADPTPSWRNSPPGDNFVVYKPNYAVPVFSEWQIRGSNTITGTELHNGGAIYGVLVDEDTARNLGYSVNNSATDADRSFGIFSSTVDGSVAAIAGKSIRVLDVHIRMQADTDRPTAGAAQTIELKQATVARTLHKFINNQQSDMLDIQFSPADSWFLAENCALEVDFTGTDVGSVTILYEYVDADEVPKDAFWGSVSPTKPSPGLAGATVKNPRQSTEIELFFPGRYNMSPTPDSTYYTQTTPTQGDQYVIYGYAASIQTLNGSGTGQVLTPDQTLFTLSSGSTPGTVAGTYGTTPLGTQNYSQPNLQFAPVFAASDTDQCINAVVDDVMIPLVPNNGRIFVDSAGFGGATGVLSALSTPGQTNNGIDDWQMSVWGRLSYDYASTPSNPGV